VSHAKAPRIADFLGLERDIPELPERLAALHFTLRK